MKASVCAVIFDLDGVIVSTDEYHYRAWKTIAGQEGIPFDRQTNNRLRGVGRMACVDILLAEAGRQYTLSKKQDLARRKNELYVASLAGLGPADLLGGVSETLTWLQDEGYRLAIGSSSRNAPLILQKLGLAGTFQAVADGNDITHSKPHPEVFLKAAEGLRMDPKYCAVVEDSTAGIDAACAAGMLAIGTGNAAHYAKTHYPIGEMTELIPILTMMNHPIKEEGYEPIL